jgi:hypothetical protein
VISQISAANRPQTKSRSSTPTTRIPCFSEIRRDAVFAIALAVGEAVESANYFENREHFRRTDVFNADAF